MTFDVLYDPWIPVVKENNEKEMLGIHEALRDAHLYKAVSCSNPLETCALMRFLIAFLMDAYSPETLSDRKRLFKQGRFSEEVLLKYEEQCRKEGVTFDLFDEKRPFMQAAYEERWDAGKEKSVGILFHAFPRGNTPLHFEHTKEENFEVPPAEAFPALLSTQLFSVAMTQGYPSGVNNTPPYYVFVQGENLFETVTVNMVSKGECGNIPWGERSVAWRDSSTVIPKEEYVSVSMLGGMTWQPRRITLTCEESGKVKTVFLQQGRNFKGNELWRDPHVTYVINKKGITVSLKPDLSRRPWQDVGAYALSENNAQTIPAVTVRNAEEVFSDDRPILLSISGLVTDQAKYEGWVSDNLNVPGRVLTDWEKADRLRADVDLTEEAAKKVYTAVNALFNASGHSNEKAKKSSSLAEEAKARFLESMHRYIFKEYMTDLSQAGTSEPGWEKEITGPLKEKLKAEALRTAGEEANRVGSDARSLEAQVNAMAAFRKAIFALCAQE